MFSFLEFFKDFSDCFSAVIPDLQCFQIINFLILELYIYFALDCFLDCIKDNKIYLYMYDESPVIRIGIGANIDVVYNSRNNFHLQ